ncbi:hypothetical protein CE91St46_33170 [Eubacteriales bacterium]|nr:hypothetical protein CE91St46_33170 [Eubacteriales bacterium]GKH64926.1 hypothetical protein CE91St47_33950 [Eubacteriales bacterium]
MMDTLVLSVRKADRILRTAMSKNWAISGVAAGIQAYCTDELKCRVLTISWSLLKI